MGGGWALVASHCMLSAAAAAVAAAVAAARRTCKNMAHVVYTSRTTCTNKMRRLQNKQANTAARYILCLTGRYR